MSVRYPLFAILAWVVGCQGSPRRERGTSAPSASSAPSATVSANETVPPIAPVSQPSDLQPSELQRALGCRANPSKKPCSILDEFSRAERFKADTPSGESRWLGRAYHVEKGVESEQFLLLHCHRMPTAQVRPGSLPLALSTSDLPIEVQVEAKRMWMSLSQGRHRANRRNLAFRFIEQYEPKLEKGLIDTAGASVQTLGELTEDAAYLRQSSLKRLLLVQPSKQTNSQVGDGTYAEFWQATW